MRTVPALAAGVGIALFLTGCGNYKSDLDNVCNSAERSGAAAMQGDSAMKARLQGEWIDKHVHSKDGKALFAKMAATSGPARVALVRGEAAKQGITSCPYVDAMESPPKP